MDLIVNYPKVQNNNQQFGQIKFKDGAASELGRQAAKFYPKKSDFNAVYDGVLNAMDQFVVRQDANKEVDIVVKKSKDLFGRKRLVAEVIPVVDTLEKKTFKQKGMSIKGRLLEFLIDAEQFANKQQEKVKDIYKMNRTRL